MNDSKNGMFSRFQVIDETYTIQFFIKKGSHAETYRVKDKEGQLYFLKLFHIPKLHPTQFDTEGRIKEIEFLKNIKHPNIVSYHDHGEWFYQNQKFVYLVLNFISGETLEEKILREGPMNPFDVKQMILGVLNGLKYLHNKDKPIVHNDINHQNIMIDLGGTTNLPRIIDFGYARYFQNSTKVYYREGLHPFYLAPECFDNVFSPVSDLFSVGALMYHLLFGIPPWFTELMANPKDRIELEEAILNARNKPLKFPSLNKTESADQETDQLIKILNKALNLEPEKRFDSADEMLKALNNEINVQSFSKSQSEEPTKKQNQKYEKSQESNGFADIAGMNALKETLYHDVIRALEEKELYEQYGLTIPNGILLYGPPGCGKSFFAEKIAEEAGYNYLQIKPSDLASIYIHGSQEKIGKLFSEARENAPTILNFEEFDALVPRRDNIAGKNQSGEVNEFLSQLNNCGKDGVFVIATTNKPNLIDTAVIRAGRIDKIFFVPPPDFKARKEMFRLFLEKRPIDSTVNYDQLAEKTENYVSIDIKHMVDEAARSALKTRSEISQEILIDTIHNTIPSVKEDDIKKYTVIREKLEGIKQNKNERPSIGFKSKK
jgi:transitional endoplasmic reticulum ATPase